MESLLLRLLDRQNASALSVSDKATFYIVPHMNSDGAVLGNLRTNAAGVYLDREWLNPSLEKSLEVYFTLIKMHETDVDLLLDIPGDEGLPPYIFMAGTEGVPEYNKNIQEVEELFKLHFILSNSDFQDVIGYPKDAPRTANLTMATAYSSHTFHCLVYTLKMLFEYKHNLSNNAYIINCQHSLRLGESFLHPIHAIEDNLREK